MCVEGLGFPDDFHVLFILIHSCNGGRCYGGEEVEGVCHVCGGCEDGVEVAFFASVQFFEGHYFVGVIPVEDGDVFVDEQEPIDFIWGDVIGAFKLHEVEV